MKQKRIQTVTPIPLQEISADEKMLRAQRRIERCILDIKRRMREMVFALSVFEPVAIREKIPIMTNGGELYYSPDYVLETDSAKLKKEVLHITLHGLLGHFEEEGHLSDRELAWAVMDHKVDRLMRFFIAGAEDRQGAAGNGREPMGLELYYRAKEDEGFRGKVLRHGKAAMSDDHNAWHMRPVGPGKTGTEKKAAEWKAAREAMNALLNENLGDSGDQETDDNGNRLEDLLEKRMGQEKQNADHGAGAGGGSFSIEGAMEEPSDYVSVLRDLKKLGTVCGEEDVPDPIYYCYGLEMYEDMPLVEPLEEAERAALETLVVAVDTSGSCVGEMPVFLQKTRELLDQLTETMDVKRVWYLECDSKIQDEVMYEGDGIRYALTEKQDYSGGGGTNFRPVFERIAEYESQGGSVAGLLYYSDGMGTFPIEVPDYPCYFIMPQGSFDHFFRAGGDDGIPKWVKKRSL